MDLYAAREPITAFLDSGALRPTLALVYGRRRIGKSTLLHGIAADRGGFYWEAPRADAAIQRQRLGEALGEHLGVGSLALDTWGDALGALLRLGDPGRVPSVPIVLDEFGYLLDGDPSLSSLVARAIGQAGRSADVARPARLVLCGSAIALMATLTAGQAPLRGRAGLELIMQPLDDRGAARLLPAGAPLELAARVYATIGGVIGYYTDMVDHDLPKDRADFDRWVAARVLSPAATLHHEATTLLAEDPTLASSSAPVHHSILGSIANGSVTAGAIANRLRRPVSNLDPALKRLVAAGFVVRTEDPIRAQRPLYALGDAFLQFHYAVLEPHGLLLRERDVRDAWRTRLSAAFDARVRGPVFEAQARAWVRRHAAPATVGGPADHVGASAVVVDGTERQLDIVVAAADDPLGPPSERTVTAVGEAKAGETMTPAHLHALERARDALGTRARDARLLLVAPAFDRTLRSAAAARGDVELVDLDRLYGGT